MFQCPALSSILAPRALMAFGFTLDVDVLDDAIMPAVDYRMPGGLSWDELSSALGAARSRRVVSINITIFNPILDRDGSIARDFTEALTRGLRAFSLPD
jgi:arginase